MSDEEASVCKVEANVWRECLKRYDYGPERPKGECDKQRDHYYSCLKAWKSSRGEKYNYRDYDTVPQCVRQSQRFHECMMYAMFEVNKCREFMLELKRCAARYDPEIRAILSDDPSVRVPVVEEVTGVRRLWFKLIGKL